MDKNCNSSVAHRSLEFTSSCYTLLFLFFLQSVMLLVSYLQSGLMEAIETLFSSLLLVDKQMRCVSGQAGGALPFPVEFVLMFTNHALWDIKRTSAVSPSQVLKSHGCQVFSPSGPCFFCFALRNLIFHRMKCLWIIIVGDVMTLVAISKIIISRFNQRSLKHVV